MPIQIDYINDGAGVDIRCSSISVTGQDIINANMEVYKMVNLHKHRYLIRDYTHVGKVSISTEEIRYIAQQDQKAAEQNPDFIIAVIAPTDLIFGLFRMWQIYTDEAQFQKMVFRRRHTAITWIDEQLNFLPPDI